MTPEIQLQEHTFRCKIVSIFLSRSMVSPIRTPDGRLETIMKIPYWICERCHRKVKGGLPDWFLKKYEGKEACYTFKSDGVEFKIKMEAKKDE